MKAPGIVSLLSVVLAGCAAQSAVHPPNTSSSPSAAAASPSTSAPDASHRTQQDTTSPRLVAPAATAGPPVMAIPLGGNLYLPVTGGPPIVGVPLTP
jgi:hypothetical protein